MIATETTGVRIPYRKGHLRVIDLFSGAGGMSLGFKTAGYRILGGVEFDPVAVQSYALNFHNENPVSLALHGKPRDILVTEPDDFIRELYPDADPATAVDVVIGGPPCQAFARVGRAKLREIAADPLAYRRDKRANLYTGYLHFIQSLRPPVLVMENVPDILNYGGHNIAEEICETLDDLGYNCRYTLLNSVYYGVPQLRERFFLIGISKELKIIPTFPEPTRWYELPSGYEGARRVALKTLYSGNQLSLFSSDYLFPPPSPSPDLPRWVSSREAMEDLPLITQHLDGDMPRGVRRFTNFVTYRDDIVPSNYAVQMRMWNGHESFLGVYDHVIRSLPRDYTIFRRMNAGDQYPQAYRHAIDLFNEEVARLRNSGRQLEEGSADYDALFRSMVPPYDVGKFPNKWRKLDPDEPARTLMAHLGKDGYSHIHYDSAQARTISVREAARLQSFPDGFRFVGTMNPAFRQIGNAVPPLMAKALASHLLKLMEPVLSKELVEDVQP